MLQKTTTAIVLVLASACALPGLGQGLHAPVGTDPSLDFQAVLEAALAVAPQARELAVRDQQAEAYVAAGEGWLAGMPNISLNYYDDRYLDERGQFEAQYGVVLPLWRFGEKRESMRLGASYEEQVQRWQAAFQLELAGRVRASLAQLAEAEAMLVVEQEATADAEELLRLTTLLFEAGTLARLDVLQAENLLLEQNKREIQAETALVDAGIAYRLLTGLELRPAQPHTERPAPATEVADNHPLLRYLQSEIDIASAGITQSEIAAKGNPQLGLGSRRERGDGTIPYTDTINISLTIPFGGKRWVAAQTSTARREKVDAEVQYFSTWRLLQQALHEAEHDLDSTRRSLPLAERQAALGEQRLAMARTAFEQGEVTLVQVLPAVQEARVAARELALLRLREQELIAQYNQVLGVLP